MSESIVLKVEPAQLVSLHNEQITTTSLKIAEAFGKRHHDVLRAIETLDCSEEYHERNFAFMFQEVEIGNGAKRKSKYYQITKDGFYFLAMGFTGKKAAAWKEAFINAFNAMEAALKSGGETLTPAEQQIIQEAVAEKAKPYGALVGKAKAEIYARLHNKFRVAKYQQLPRTRITDAVIYITNMQLKLKAQTPISSKQYHQLKDAINRAYGTYIFTESDRQWAMNRIRVQYNIQNITQLPQQHFDEAMEWIQTELTQQTSQLFDLLTQLKEKFNKEVVNNNAPWTAEIIKKYKQQTQQQLPQTINWLELANQANLISQ